MSKILFVSNTANFSKFNIPFMRWCRQNGWCVDYASPNDEPVKECDHFFDIEMTRSPLFILRNIKSIQLLRKILNEQHYDILHCHTPMGAAIARLASRKLWLKKKIKIIYTAHGFHFFKGAPFINWIVFYPVEKFLSKYTDVLILINEEDYQLAHKKHFKAGKIVKIDGVGVNLGRFYPIKSIEEKFSLRKQKGFSKNDFILLYIAEFIPRKNHKLLFSILPVLIGQIPEVKIILVGKGKLLEHYKQISKENGFDKNITFTGYIKDVNVYCHISDICISSSFQEGLALNLVEGMACGLPLIASKIRGHIDIIKNDANGFLCDLHDKTSFIKAVILFYKNLALRKEIGSHNSCYAQKFSVDIAVQKMAEIYKKIM